MAIVYGLTKDGLVIKTLAVIRAETEASLREAFGPSLPLGDKTLFGQINGIYSEREASVWQLVQVVDSSQDPNKAVDAALDAVCAITGTVREPATNSTVDLTLAGTPTTNVLAGTQAKTTAEDVFQTTQDAIIVILPSWSQPTAYAAGDRVTNSSKCYLCITSGTSGSPGPTSTSLDFTDGGGVHWEYIGDGTGVIDVPATAVNTGPVIGTAGDIKFIVTPVGGLSTIRNILDAVLGTDVQSNEGLRLLREEELSGDGTGTADAIRGKILKITGVFSANVFVNNTDVIDADGLPPHSIECLVYTPSLDADTDQAIVDTIFANVAAGIQTYSGASTVTGTAVDSEGVSHTILFSRPTQIPIYVDVSVVYDAKLYPSDGDVEIEAAIVAFGNTGIGGKDAVPAAIGAQAFKVDGVNDVSRVMVYTDVLGTPAPWVALTGYFATPTARSIVTNDGGRAYICITSGTSAASGGPTGVGTDITDGTAHWYFLGNTIAISSRQLATFDTSRTVAHSSAGTP